jgi:hypothetical protein
LAEPVCPGTSRRLRSPVAAERGGTAGGGVAAATPASRSFVLASLRALHLDPGPRRLLSADQAPNLRSVAPPKPSTTRLSEDLTNRSIREAKAFIRFLDETGLFAADSEPVDVLLDHLDAIEEQFRHNMADASRYSFGKRLWTTAQAEGVRLDDRASVEAFIADFNARPIAERDAILGPSLPLRPHATGRFTPPGTRPKAPSTKRRKRRR